MLYFLTKDLASLAKGDSIFSGSAEEKLARLRDELAPLAACYDVVVANPPYMGGKNMNRWLGVWVKRRYPDVKGDLFSCFVARNIALGAEHAQLGFMTPYVWMFIGTYEKLRRFMIEECTITSLIQLEYSGFAGATVPICTFTLQKGCQQGYRGGYIRLSDFPGADNQAPKVLEALADPECGWFYRTDSDLFSKLPGFTIAYWASNGIKHAFEFGVPLSKYVEMPYGFKTGDNDRFLRLWWECEVGASAFDVNSDHEAASSGRTWFPYNKGGAFRKWYGNNYYVLNYRNAGREVLGDAKTDGRSAADYNHDLFFKPVVTWSRISSGRLHMRYSPYGSICDMTGSGYYGPQNTIAFLQAYCNSTIALQIAGILSPTLDFQPGQIGNYPILGLEEALKITTVRVEELRLISKQDWNDFETSWGFERHPLI